MKSFRQPRCVWLLGCVLISAFFSRGPSASLVHGATPNVPLATSTFDTDAEGWTTDADARCHPAACYAATDGNPGGYIYSDDLLQGIKFYYVAPSKFLGNKVAAYQQHLTFEMRQATRGTIATNDVDVVLVGGGITLVFDAPRNPPAIWFPYDLPLDETSGWRKGSVTGPRPTAAEMQSVLGSLTQLRIRGDFILGQATSNLDNVVLGGPSVPLKNVYETFLPYLTRYRSDYETFLPFLAR